MKVGVFLARMQPVHKAHVYVVKKICKECDRVVVMLGSANKMDMIRNPFNIDLRIVMLIEAIESSIGKEYADKIEVYEIPDWTKENDLQNQKEWGRYFYYNTVARAKTKEFSIYYSDDPETMLDWFDDEIKERIDFNFLERSSMFDGLSATKIREAFSRDDKEYIKKYCPDVIYRSFDELKAIWDGVLENPKKDFSMK